MRWALLCALLLLMAWPAPAQDGCGCSGIEEDSKPKAGEEPEKKPEPKPEPEPEKPPPDEKPPENFTAPTAENIDRAIDRGVAWLKKAQKEDGSFGPCIASHLYGEEERSDHALYVTGPTSFAIFTLAECGVPERDPVIQKGLKWLQAHLRHEDRPTTYESASLILMLTALYAPTQVRHASPVPGKRPAGTKFGEDDWTWMHERVSLLVRSHSGGWRYHETEHDQDASATQLVLLALREAARAGYPVTTVAPDVWRDAAEAVRGFQMANGGFRYRRDYPWTAGMTAACIASLLICKEQMILGKQKVPDWLDESVKKGIAFLGEAFDVTRNRHQEGSWKELADYHYYHLYGLERAGVLSNRNEFGGKAWYPRGAAYLLEQQQEGGQWDDKTCMRPKDTLATCFALLFLKRATPPPAVTVSGD